MSEKDHSGAAPVSAKLLVARLTAELQAAEQVRATERLVLHDGGGREDRELYDARAEILRLLALRLDMTVSRLRLDLPLLQLQEADAVWLTDAARRLAADEPFAYVAGRTDFAGISIRVGPGVLIPRPDSEVLVWQAARIIGQEASESRSWTVLDIGTGSGALALALQHAVAQTWPRLGLRILGTERSLEALAWARLNRREQGREESFELVACDLLPEPQMAADWRADMVLSNPPYIPHAALRGLEHSVREYEPHEALDGGPDGLDCYRRLAALLPAWMRAGAHLLLEHGDRQQTEVEAIMTQGPFVLERRLQDLAGRPRALWLRHV
ncbi:MAG: peptide chain release factor N(5)-glutamine methyltransferase [Bacillota bacterium]|nr:peptide chain release factor N(5)-glutamine methyltransferase [Bacillota bacterium]